LFLLLRKNIHGLKRAFLSRRTSVKMIKQNTFSYRIIFISFTLLSISSCSWIDSGRTSLFGGDDEDVASTPEQEMVPKEQFDELTKKYENLLKNRRVEDSETQRANQLMNRVESEQVIDSDLVADEISKVKAASQLGGTVDIFNQKGNGGTAVQLPINIPKNESYDANLVESQITEIRNAESLVAQNKFDAAITKIKTLENSPLKQIKVRAKFLLGEILFKQGEYDLSMQIFEEVVNQYAFSGLVIKTLGRLIVCSEKLKLAAKQEKYYSILHDFFEQGA